MLRMLPNLPRLLAGALLLLGIAQPALAGVFCVNTAVGLQNSLTTAASNGVDDEVWIVQGTYVGNFVYASGQANQLSVLGGYTAGCAGRVLDPVNTILDGNQTNSTLVLSAPGVAADFLVEGLTLRNGQHPSGFAGYGGGLSVGVGRDGAVTVHRNRIENNLVGAYLSATTATLTNNSIAGNTGSGASISATSATLTNNSIAGNTVSGASISATTATLTNNSISGNTTASQGGGANISATTATLTNNSISGNTAGGGGASISATTATLTNNSISGNTASYNSYARDGAGGANISATTATLTNNSISGNTAASQGGGANISATTATLTNNSITGNTTSLLGGGASLSATTATLTNNTLVGNTAVFSGGGAFIEGDNATLTNNSISGNTSSSGSGGGAFINAEHGTATLTNNTFVDNEGFDGGGLYLQTGTTETTDSATLYNNLFWANWATRTGAAANLSINNDSDSDYVPTPVTLLANNFDQSAAGFQSTLPITLDPSNLDAEDPLFVDQVAGNLRPAPGSPMIDAGYPDTPNLPATDLDGGLRVVNGTVDMGAYEYHEYESCDVNTLTLDNEVMDSGGDNYGSLTFGVGIGSDPYDRCCWLTHTPRV